MTGNTLLLWEKHGVLKPVKTPGGRRRYRREDIEQLLGLLEDQPGVSTPKVVLYARVSTRKQSEYLKNQVERLKKYAEEKNWQYEIISELVSTVPVGVKRNDNRPVPAGI